MQAQISDNSPYTRFGIGELQDNNFLHLRHMGGLGSSFIDPYLINIVNPASLGSLQSTAFDMSVFNEFSTLSDGENTNTSFNGNLEYISLAFPTSNPINDLFEQKKRDTNYGMAFTLMPHSIVGYDITNTETADTLGQIRRNFQGSGGTYKFMFSQGYKYKNFSAGLNLGYLFGKIRYTRDIVFLDNLNAFSVDYERNYSVSGFLWNLGFIYSQVLNKSNVDIKKGIQPKVVNIGLRANTNTGFSTNSNIIDLHRNYSSNVVDTVRSVVDVKGKGTLPAEIGIGATYLNGSKLALGVDLSAASWANYKNDANPEELSNTFMLTFGGYIRPNYKSFSYFDRVYYRFGGFYGNDPRVVNGTQIDNYGLTAGFGLPFVFQKKISHANLGLTIGRRGTGTDIQETYYRFTFGFTFNDDEWFIKRKYN